MHIPYVPRVLVFSFFKQLAVLIQLVGKEKKILQYLQKQGTVGKDKREDSVFTDFPQQKLKYEKLKPLCA